MQLPFGIKSNQFLAYDLGDVDSSLFVLSDYQQAVIQNAMADIAQQKINMEFNSINHIEFVREFSTLTGRIQAFQALLDLSSDSKEFSESSNLNNKD